MTKTFGVGATSRFNVDAGALFPELLGKRFGVVVESLPAGGASGPDRGRGGDVPQRRGGVAWAAGANALATRLR